MKVKKQLLSLKAYQPGKSIDEVKREFGLTKIAKLASNENPYGCSPKVREALNDFTDYALYPDGAAFQLREKLARHVGVELGQIIFSAGLDEMIQIISRSLLSPDTNVVMAEQTFPQYKHHAVIEQAEIREVPLKNGCHDLEAMLAQVDEQTAIVWICNPNNPTGTYVNETELKHFLEHVPKETLVVLDEAYYEYAVAQDYPESIPLLNDYENLLIMRTFSKAYGLAAFRIGYTIGHASFMQKLDVARLPFNTSTFAQIAAMAALDDQAFIEFCVEENRKGLQQYYTFCETHQLPYYSSQCNFIFMDPGKDPMEVFQLLQQKGYIVRPQKGGVRITVGTKEENDGVLEALKELITVQA
ncbi:histidinol-phosphate transaminase [Fictibacillus gelatini]|uniref:histidinol-phosphate transaminase n=1 Tax=Fictibacillus gelatini TaxID=225985 RepID=UPI0004138C93|nr:histidinol-phosphate transaminase [Fictibacillus gelatini]